MTKNKKLIPFPNKHSHGKIRIQGADNPVYRGITIAE